MRELKDLLESLYKKLNKRGLVDPEPQHFKQLIPFHVLHYNS